MDAAVALVAALYPAAAKVALAVDDEPTPFWEGDGELDFIAAWRQGVGFRDEWGHIQAAPRFNGPSGQKLRKMLLDPLALDHGDVWVTDCLDLYHASKGNAGRVTDTYQALVEHLADGPASLPEASLLPHPTEAEIVRMAISQHIPRLLAEIQICVPDRIVTLGNAALRVIRHLAGAPEDVPSRLSANASYGQPRQLVVGGRSIELVPLAHPAAPAVYQEAHQRWLESGPS